jgi:hypothetical protein
MLFDFAKERASDLHICQELSANFSPTFLEKHHFSATSLDKPPL